MSLTRKPGALASVDVPSDPDPRPMLIPHKCLRCDGLVLPSRDAMQCAACGAEWPMRDGVPLYSSAAYFGEVSQPEMETLIRLASQTNWRTAISTQFREHSREEYREQYYYAADLNRASWIPLLPIPPDSTVLDVGSGLGALTHALALNYARVVSVEPVDQRVRFTRLRLEQEGLTNVDLIQTTVDAMPFADQTFDLIVLNGILEWVAAWHAEGAPRDVQLDVLRKLRRMLKPGGVLLIGIENRIGFESFLGRVDHSGLSFTSVMPRWLASLYMKLRRPGFHRTLLDSSRGYRTYTYSPRGYDKLLHEAGFESVDQWWPRDGYNLPHVMYRLSDREEIRDESLNECNAANRINGYALRRVLKQRVLDSTGLLFDTFPDLILLARHSATPLRRSPRESSLIEALQSAIASTGEHAAAHAEPCHPSVLMGRKLRNKSIIKLATSTGTIAICKLANVHLPRAEAIEHAYQLLGRLRGLFEVAGPPLSGSTPRPMGLIRHGSSIASIESPAPGSSIGSTALEGDYFTNRERVARHLEFVSAWLVMAQATLAQLQTEFGPRGIPLQWRTMSDASTLGDSDRPSWVQHGDFFPTNVILDERSGRLSVIDWDSCNAGYPPLFDWFCFVTGLYYTHQRVRRLPKGQTVDAISFEQTFFDSSWFAEKVVALTVRLAESAGLDRRHILDYFADYLAVRHHQFEDDRDSGSKDRWGRLFKQFYAFFMENQHRCIFHPRRV